MIQKLTTLLFIFCLSAYSMSACSCFDIPEVEESYNQSQEVFVGMLISKEVVRNDEGNPKYYKCTFDVLESWKSQNTRQISIYTSYYSSACGYSFEDNTSYLVYASRTDAVSPLRTDLCTRTMNFAYAKEDAQVLNELRVKFLDNEEETSYTNDEEEKVPSIFESVYEMILQAYKVLNTLV